jgi:acyl-CoA synthetase (NDP forming)
LRIIALPADAVHNVVAQAAPHRSAYVVSEGFADAATDEGRERQERLVTRARTADMAVAGPNCMGVASLHHRFAVTMADIPGAAMAGGVSFVSQSGGLLNSVAELATNRGVGISYCISSGNGRAGDGRLHRVSGRG